LIPDLTNWGLRRRCWVARIVFFVKRGVWSRGWRTALVDWLSRIDFIFVRSVNGLWLSANWSANHVIALGVRYSHIFDGFGVLRLACSGLISVDAVIFLTRSSLISKLFGSWWRRPCAIDRLLAQGGSSWTALAILR
jgi:hypothetical protein